MIQAETLTYCVMLVIIIIDNRKRIVKALGQKIPDVTFPVTSAEANHGESLPKREGRMKWERNIPTEHNREPTEEKSIMRKNLQNTTAAE